MSELPVYPRWRGELVLMFLRASLESGLSPLARGTHSARRCSLPPRRFIPAGAGNSTLPGILSRKTSVYPRWRGELTSGRHFNIASIGLSPLARGTLATSSHHSGASRFIPAGAGNSTFCTLNHRYCAVYPRWRGELSKSIHLFLKHFFP